MLYNTYKTARRLKVTPQTVRRYVKDPDIPLEPVNPTGHLMFTEEAINRFEAWRRDNPIKRGRKEDTAAPYHDWRKHKKRRAQRHADEAERFATPQGRQSLADQLKGMVRSMGREMPGSPSISAALEAINRFEDELWIAPLFLDAMPTNFSIHNGLIQWEGEGHPSVGSIHIWLNAYSEQLAPYRPRP